MDKQRKWTLLGSAGVGAGLGAGLMYLLDSKGWVKRLVDDQTLGERVRSKVMRAVSHPAAVKVAAQAGRVILTGFVLAPEVDRLLSTVARIRGVKDVDCLLEIYERSGEHPALTGG